MHDICNVWLINSGKLKCILWTLYEPKSKQLVHVNDEMVPKKRIHEISIEILFPNINEMYENSAMKFDMNENEN